MRGLDGEGRELGERVMVVSEEHILGVVVTLVKLNEAVASISGELRAGVDKVSGER